MKLKEHNLESLRKIIRLLEVENRKLKERLKAANISYQEDEDVYDEFDFDLDQGGRINNEEVITPELANKFFSMFRGRKDVYAKRSKNGGYFPQCKNRWNDICPIEKDLTKKCVPNCKYKEWKPLSLYLLQNHLYGSKEDGSDVIGIYPLLEDNTCRFLVFDFDNHNSDNKDDYINEIEALREMCKENDIDCLVERSRSGTGGHVWIFFEESIPAALARNFGYILLEKGSMSINIRSFKYYDRMYPSQDECEELGNLIALPLQGQALKNGNSAFVDENWNAYENQYNILFDTRKYTKQEIKEYIEKWQIELSQNKGKLEYLTKYERVKPWLKNNKFNKSDVAGMMHISLSNGIYVDSINLMPRIQNEIRSLAAFDNPVYYKNKYLGYSNYDNASYIYLGRDIDDYINIPRGLLDKLVNKCKEANIEYEISNEREIKRRIRVEFKGNLKTQQDIASTKILEYDDGILEATTAFGKTVVGSYLISKRKVSTLILVDQKTLIDQWFNELNSFLEFNEKMPEYKTPKGFLKTRENIVGILQGGKNSMNGIVDIAMIESLANKENINEILSNYGMIIFDECHKAASETSIKILRNVNSRYVYGFSATTKRADKLEQIIYMYLGPIRHSYTSKQRVMEQGIDHFIYPRFTRVIDTFDYRNDINRAYSIVCENELRNKQIMNDVITSINNKKTVLVLTRYKKHAQVLYEGLQNKADEVLLLIGSNSDKENRAIIDKIKNISDDKTMIIVATGQKAGEGFNVPRLDTLMLAAPLSDPSRIEQYVGRINRDYATKKEVVVYDYIDRYIKVFENMYFKRLKTYKRIGYKVKTEISEKQEVKSFYDSNNYADTFEQDIIESNKNIIISSPNITKEKIDRFIELVKDKQEDGIEITILTCEDDRFDDIDNIKYKLKVNGVNLIVKENVYEHFAIMDNEIIWYGGMNFLGKADIYDNLMRWKSKEAANELLELELFSK